MEEELYRRRSVRLAEHGFLPYEEALAVYAPLLPESLASGADQEICQVPEPAEKLALTPRTPLQYAGQHTVLTGVLAGSNDPDFMDRMRLEFAGLCNQIFSVAGHFDVELDALLETGRLAAGYVNLALEERAGTDLRVAAALLERHSLLELFRVGFGLALTLKWEVERWLPDSWFHSQQLAFEFWGTPWGDMLVGLSHKRPLFLAGWEGGREFRGFERLDELRACRRGVQAVMALDTLLAAMTVRLPPPGGTFQQYESTFHPLLFNAWARALLQEPAAFDPLTRKQVQAFFALLRRDEKGPPYRMKGFREVFVQDLSAYTAPQEEVAQRELASALCHVWDVFRTEYERVPKEHLDDRYSRLVQVTRS